MISLAARELNEVPFWSPEKPEALLREGQAHLSIDRARDAELAFLEVIRDDPLHPISLALHHDASQELLKIYAIEDRWEDAYLIIWRSYEHAKPVDHPALLSMRLRPELERVSHKESSSVLRRYVAAQPDDWEAFRALALCRRHSGSTLMQFFTFRHVSRADRMTYRPGAIILPCSWTREI